MKNPLSNGRIVQKKDYLKRDQKRGQIDYPMSRSELMDFAACPSKWIEGKPSDDSTPSTDWGQLIDTLLTEPILFDQRFAIKPADYLNKENEEKPFNLNSKWCKEWVAGQGGKTCITQDDYTSALAAIARLRGNSKISEFITGAKFQVFVETEYRDADTGLVIPIRCLIDAVPTSESNRRRIGDFKTAKSGDLSTWGRVIHKYDYDAQGAMYLDAYNATAGEDRDIFVHIIQENEPPFETATPMLSDEFIKLGRAKYTEALALYCQCLKTNHWPGYNELVRDQIDGWPIVEPEPYMIMARTNPDPSWLREEAA